MFFIPEKQQKTILNFSLDSLSAKENMKHQKMLHLLKEASEFRVMTNKWNIAKREFHCRK